MCNLTKTSQPLRGQVFDIQHFSLHDGPGIRTTVFLKGCPLRCSWCHNPESYSSGPQMMYRAAKCVNCGKCVSVCGQGCHKIAEQGHVFLRDHCIGCGRCADACLFEALKTAGQTMTVDEVMRVVREDTFLFDTSGGGLTLSGGEPMYQAEFAIALAEAAQRENIGVCLETSGFCAASELERIFPYIDSFLFDYKLTGNHLHKQYTGVSNELILENLHMLDHMGANIVLRCPIIPRVNMDDGHRDGIIAVAKSIKHLKCIELEAYHNVGVSKREQLGMHNVQMITPPEADEGRNMAEAIQKASGVKCVCV